MKSSMELATTLMKLSKMPPKRPLSYQPQRMPSMRLSRIRALMQKVPWSQRGHKSQKRHKSLIPSLKEELMLSSTKKMRMTLMKSSMELATTLMKLSKMPPKRPLSYQPQEMRSRKLSRIKKMRSKKLSRIRAMRQKVPRSQRGHKSPNLSSSQQSTLSSSQPSSSQLSSSLQSTLSSSLLSTLSSSQQPSQQSCLLLSF